ncbi:MAG: hypothetical protein OCU12_06340 [Methanophagales archaeon]|nr:hypothetical protein [Methanophagales archaeon]
MTKQEKIEELAYRVFGKARFLLHGFVYTAVVIRNDEPYLVRHDGLGNTLDSARWDGQKWVVIDAQNKEGGRDVQEKAV